MLELGRRTLIMGIINVTPDSFSDGGQRFDHGRAVADALQMAADGADLLDIGGESTRPGASPVDGEEEWRRVGPVVRDVCERAAVPVSIDTSKASVAVRALDAGATIVNDISGLTFDPDMAAVVARRQAAVILMHTRGRPQAMYAEADYADVVEEVMTELRTRGREARDAGIAADRVIYDPGFGFAKRAGHSLALLAGLGRLHALGAPLLSGPSRKSFLTLEPDTPPAQRDWETAAAVTASVLAGVHIVRVHRVADMVRVVRAADAILTAG